MTRLLRILILMLLPSVAALAQIDYAAGSSGQSPFDELYHLNRALELMEMTTDDLGFDKDHGEPKVVLEGIRKLLANPMDLPSLAGESLEVLRDEDFEPTWKLAAKLLESEKTVYTRAAPWRVIPWKAKLDPVLAQALNEFVLGAEHAAQLLETSLGDVSQDNRVYAACSHLAGTFNAADRPHVWGVLHSAGIPRDMVERVMEESKRLDPEPSADAFIAILRDVDLGNLLRAGYLFHSAVSRLSKAVSEVGEWPGDPVTLKTGIGDILVATTGDEVHDASCLLILDPGGDDVYRDASGVANGLLQRPLAALVDLAGNDRYESGEMLGAGSAVFGLAACIDLEGNDLYQAAYVGQGAALFGSSWLEDQAGNDRYEAYAFSQGAAAVGLGVLRDGEGRDIYDVGLMGQAFAGVMGAGFLVDREGNDLYRAGGREPDHERHDNRYLSLAQGMAIGLRPFAGGGYAMLADLEGNDVYQADIYGQGVSYWYSVGMLFDESGNDAYTMHHYGQGSGIHMSLGLLSDGGGQDTYNGFILAQGNAHDYGVGMLLEMGGHDTYTADHHAQGRALNNALALLLDFSGDDAYFGRQNDQCQGIGNNGGKREYGSLGMLLDLEGKDQYSCGAQDGKHMLRPDYGIVYDVGDKLPHE